MIRKRVLLVPDDSVTDWVRWQKKLKQETYLNQFGKCARCKKLTAEGDLHHALLSKGNAQGVPDRRGIKKLLHHGLNVMYVCKECHPVITKREAWEIQRDLWGRYMLDDFWTEMQGAFKGKLPRY